jgi:hypothetical protein
VPQLIAGGIRPIAILIMHVAAAVLESERSQPAHGIVVVLAFVELTVRIGHYTATLCVSVVQGWVLFL